MFEIRLSKPSLRFAALGMVLIGALGANQAFADAGSYDGLYGGTQAVTFGSKPVCGSDGAVSITVKGNAIEYRLGDFPLKSAVNDDGHFRSVVGVGGKRSGDRRTIRTKGTISDAKLEADLNTRDFTGRLCSYHWSLRRQ